MPEPLPPAAPSSLAAEARRAPLDAVGEALKGTADADPRPALNGTADADPRPALNGTADADPRPALNGTADADPQPALHGISLVSLLEDLGPPSSGSERRAASLIGVLVSGRYRIEELLGQGGMGAVYRGEQIHLRKRVAIKVLHPDVEQTPGVVERFEREAVAGAHVQHPNVAAAIDFGKLDDGSYFLVLEYVEGTPLSTVLQEGPLPARRALRIARQMAAALAAVHEMGIVHRDVKPHNTLLGPDDHVKIIDFGLAKVSLDALPHASRWAAPRDSRLTSSGMIFGTPGYLAPEAALGMAEVDARSDLYALGATLYEMLCGCRPFEWTDEASLFQRLRAEDPPAIGERAPEVSVPAEAERVAMRLMQRAPRDRFGSAREALEAIDTALAAIERSTVLPSRAPGPDRVRRWMPAALAVGLLVFAWQRLSPGPIASVAPPLSAPASLSAVSAPAPVASAPIAPEVSPTEVDNLDTAGFWALFEKSSAVKDWTTGSRAFLALARREPALLDDEITRARVVALAAGIAHEGPSELSTAIFDVLTSQAGAGGLDALYELAVSRGGTRGGHLAREILLRPDVKRRESPALRIAIEFFAAPCATRRRLLDRAAAEGDRRTLVQLQEAHVTRRCGRDNRRDEALIRLRARLAN